MHNQTKYFDPRASEITRGNAVKAIAQTLTDRAVMPFRVKVSIADSYDPSPNRDFSLLLWRIASLV